MSRTERGIIQNREVLLRKREVLLRKIERCSARLAVEGLVSLLVSEVKVNGEQNLEEFRRHLGRGRSLLVVPNHLSNLDPPVVQLFLEARGFGKPVFISGLKLKRNLITNVLVNAGESHVVWPESLEAVNDAEKREKMRMNFHTVRESIEMLNKGGVVLIVFPEGTRSREGCLGRGLPGIAGYITKQTVVMPIGIWGTERRMPIGGWPIKRGPVTINVGEPIDGADLLERFRWLPKDERRSQMIGYVMRDIAHLLPGKYRGVYSGRDTIAFG